MIIPNGSNVNAPQRAKTWRSERLVILICKISFDVNISPLKFKSSVEEEAFHRREGGGEDGGSILPPKQT